MRRMKRRRKRTNRVARMCISGMVLALTLMMSVQIVHLYKTNEEYRQEEIAAKAELKDEQARAAELEEQEAYVGSEQYIIDTAKSKLGMTFPDEIVFKEE